jgi:hypothetical protein
MITKLLHHKSEITHNMKVTSQVACYMSHHVATPHATPQSPHATPCVMPHVKQIFTAYKFFYEILILSEKSKNDQKKFGSENAIS